MFLIVSNKLFRGELLGNTVGNAQEIRDFEGVSNRP